MLKILKYHLKDLSMFKKFTSQISKQTISIAGISIFSLLIIVDRLKLKVGEYFI